MGSYARWPIVKTLIAVSVVLVWMVVVAIDKARRRKLPAKQTEQRIPGTARTTDFSKH